ncbi:hypothetical protein S245_024976, partial [Arachis hypogaea]
LNSAFLFNTEKFEKYRQMTSSLLDVIEKYAYGDPNLNSTLTSEIRIFKNDEQDFGRPSAIRKQSTIMQGKLVVLQVVSVTGVFFNTFTQRRGIEWILKDSPQFLTPKKVDALQNEFTNMHLQSPLDDL